MTLSHVELINSRCTRPTAERHFIAVSRMSGFVFTMKASFSYILSGIAILLGIVAIITKNPSQLPYEFDYLGLLVGVLAFLTALLLG